MRKNLRTKISVKIVPGIGDKMLPLWSMKARKKQKVLRQIVQNPRPNWWIQKIVFRNKFLKNYWFLRLELVIVSSNFQALLFLQGKLLESVWKLLIPLKQS